MTTQTEALKLALEALRMPCSYFNKTQFIKAQEAITAIKEALAQPGHEKYCSVCQGCGQVDTGIIESPVTICNACNGTGLKAQPDQDPVAILQCQPKHGPVLWHDVTEEESNAERFHPEFFNFRIVYTTPPQRKPLTDEMIVAGGKALAKLHAETCGLDFDDVWKYYAEDHKADAKAAIEAAHGIKE